MEKVVWTGERDQGAIIVTVLVVDLFLLLDLSMPKNLRMVLAADSVKPATGLEENSIGVNAASAALLLVV